MSTKKLLCQSALELLAEECARPLSRESVSDVLANHHERHTITQSGLLTEFASWMWRYGADLEKEIYLTKLISIFSKKFDVYTRDKDRMWLVPKNFTGSTKDTLVVVGGELRTWHYRENPEDYAETHVVWSNKQLEEATEKLHNDKYLDKPVQEISEDDYNEMFECLPPANWSSRGNFDCWHCPELQTHDIASWYAHNNKTGKHYQFYASCYSTDEQLLAKLNTV